MLLQRGQDRLPVVAVHRVQPGHVHAVERPDGVDGPGRLDLHPRLGRRARRVHPGQAPDSAGVAIIAERSRVRLHRHAARPARAAEPAPPV